MVLDFIAKNVTFQLIKFFVPELLFLLFIENSGGLKFRFSSVDGYPGLKPFANTWVVGLSAILIYLFGEPIFSFLFNTSILKWLESLVWHELITLTLTLFGFTLIFIVNYVFEKEIDKFTWITGVFSGISLVLFFWL